MRLPRGAPTIVGAPLVRNVLRSLAGSATDPGVATRKRVHRMARPRGKKWGMLAIRLALAIVVVAAVGRHIARTCSDLVKHGTFPRLETGWIVLGIVLYLVGLGAFGIYFWRVMDASATPI